jgi:hypothetical protein
MPQIVSANLVACASSAKPAAPLAPPRLSVTSVPAAWHAAMSRARNAQLGRPVPASAGWVVVLHAFARSREGVSPGPEKKASRNAMGRTSIVPSPQ